MNELAAATSGDSTYPTADFGDHSTSQAPSTHKYSPPTTIPTVVEVSLDEAKRFLAALAPTGQISFQTLCINESLIERDGMAKLRLNKLMHGSLAEHQEKLKGLNDKGACVFVMANQGNGRGRKGEDVTSIRSVFVDLDGAPLEPVLAAPIPPSITVETSPGRFHAYWLVREMPIRDFKPAQQKLAKKFNGDGNICDPPRLMRLPGFLHRKTDKAFQSRLITCESELVWDWSVLAKAFDLPKSMTFADRILEGNRNSELFGMAVASRRIGIAKEQRLRTLLTVNAERCSPPLPEVEVAGIVDRAYNLPLVGTLQIPLTLLTHPKFLPLTVGSKLFLLLSYQRLNGHNNGEIPLLWNDFKQHFRRENTFCAYRKKVVDAGFLEVTRRARKSVRGEKPQCALYKFTHTIGGA